MAPYRESLSRLLAGTELSGAPYYLLTYASLALFYFVAMHSGSIWVPLQFVGATAGAGRAAGLGGAAWEHSKGVGRNPTVQKTFTRAARTRSPPVLTHSARPTQAAVPLPLCAACVAAGALIAFIFPAWIALRAIRCRDPSALASQV